MLRSDTKYIFRDVRVEFGLEPLKKGKSMFRNRTVQITITSFLFQIKLSTSLIFNSCFVRSGIRQKGQGTARSGVNFYNSLIMVRNLVPIISSLLSPRLIKTNKPSLDNEIFGVRKSMFGFNIGRVWPLVLRCFWTPLKTSAQEKKSAANFILISSIEHRVEHFTMLCFLTLEVRFLFRVLNRIQIFWVDRNQKVRFSWPEMRSMITLDYWQLLIAQSELVCPPRSHKKSFAERSTLNSAKIDFILLFKNQTLEKWPFQAGFPSSSRGFLFGMKKVSVSQGCRNSSMPNYLFHNV